MAVFFQWLFTSFSFYSCQNLPLTNFLSSTKDIFFPIAFREVEGRREKGRERETSMWERNINLLLPARSWTGYWTSNQAGTLTGIKQQPLGYGTMFQQTKPYLPGQNFSFLKGYQLYWIRAHPNDLVLTNYICSNPISKLGHILRHWVLGLRHRNWGGIVQPLNSSKLFF